MAINRPKEIKNVGGLGDRIAAKITKFAGSMHFLVGNVVLFVGWILLNNGVFGEDLIIDKFPFGFLTMTVSIEAIILSTFVLMSQRRQSKVTEIRTRLDYHADIQAEVHINTIVHMLERIANAQGVDVADLLKEMKTEEKNSTAEDEYAKL